MDLVGPEILAFPAVTARVSRLDRNGRRWEKRMAMHVHDQVLPSAARTTRASSTKRDWWSVPAEWVRKQRELNLDADQQRF